MRLALVIILLTAIAVGLVHIRRAQITVCHEARRVQLRRVKLRRRLQDQQVELGRLTAPHRVNDRLGNIAPEVAAGGGR